jgi:serine/threonine protein phosphatase PrpC
MSTAPTTTETFAIGTLRVCAAWRPIYAGEPCGDVCLAIETRTGALVAAIDGGGHGADARAAATVVSRALGAARDEPLDRMLALVHAEMRGTTRGAAAAIVLVGEGCAEWVSIGNVAGGVLHEGTFGAELRRDAGSLGLHLPVVDVTRLELPPRGLVVLATDGVERTFLSSTTATADRAALASEILSRFRKGGDDALVVVAARAAR